MEATRQDANSNRSRRTRNQLTAGRSGAEVYREESGGVVQRSQVTFEATLATRTTVSIEKKTAVHLAPPLKALKPNGGSYLECNVEKRMFVYLFLRYGIPRSTRALRYVRGPWHRKNVFTPANGLEINIV